MAQESSRKFKFISPGVFVNEIDQSQLPAEAGDVGPVVIGTAPEGPLMRPMTVNSFSEFVGLFGNPLPGGEGGDVWRNGNKTAPTYGAYAAQAYLSNGGPLTFIRLGGQQNDNATEAGYAGWKAGTINSTPNDGGAWGIFVFPSSSIGTGSAAADPVPHAGAVTGALAATIYCTNGRVFPSGTLAGDALKNATSDAWPASRNGCTLVNSDAAGNITLGITDDGTEAATEYVTVNFDPSSKQFIRKVLNTNPTVTNSNITTAKTRASAQGGNYWLGESYETMLSQETAGGIGVLGNPDQNAVATGGLFRVAVLPLETSTDTTQEQNDRRYTSARSTTGWFIAQDLGATPGNYQPENMEKLFRLEALAPGLWTQQKIKISISNINYAQGDFQEYGTFSVLVRDLRDTDKKPRIIERFDNLNLNPASANYIAKIIGDKYVEYSQSDRGNREYGQYDNKSDYIRVVMNDDIEAGAGDPDLLPFGVFGPVTYRPFSLISGSSMPVQFGTYIAETRTSTAAGGVSTMVNGGDTSFFGAIGGSHINGGDAATSPVLALTGAAITAAEALKVQYSASIVFPTVPLRKNNTSFGAPNTLKSCFWGVWTGKSSTNPNFSPCVIDATRNKARGLETNMDSTTLGSATSGSLVSSGSSPIVTDWIFTLDDVVGDGGLAQNWTYSSGSRTAGTSLSAVSGSYTASLDAGLDRFTTVMFGGTDGLDITFKNPFMNSNMDGGTVTTNYELNSLRNAINIVSDPEDLQYNLITIPGVTQPLVTDYLLEMVEDRADALAIIDIPNVYTPASDSNETAATRRNFTVKQAVDDLKDRSINNSYGATYMPWVLARDTNTNRTLWMPPSVAALGAMATNDKLAAPWFAPAGFNRGGLSEGAAGLPILDVTRRLTSDDRDSLYEANINPIAKFPAEGIVIFGQKTLQQTASALDRINVRRLMIFLKREISFIASRLLFGPNVPATWANFTTQAVPLLKNVKAQFGVDDFKLVLDETTTTPDLVDRNIIYAKLFIKPTRAAEYFAIDFVVTRSGASFDD